MSRLDFDLITTETAANFAAVNYLHEAEFGLVPEGSTRQIKGKEYVLTNHRWRSKVGGIDAKTKYKPPNEDEEERKIDEAPSERLSQIDRRLSAIKEHLENQGWGLLDTTPYEDDIDALDRLRERIDRRITDEEDRSNTPEKQKAELEDFYKDFAKNYAVGRNEKGYLVISAAPRSFEGGIVHSKKRTIGQNKDLGVTLVHDEEAGRSIKEKGYEIISKEETREAAPILDRYLRRYGDLNNPRRIYHVIKLSDRDASASFSTSVN